MTRYRQLLILILLGSMAVTQASYAVLYTNDAQTRREATEVESNSILFLRSTAFLVDENTIVTAKHVATDGAFAVGLDHFVVVQETLEESQEALGDIDYKIQRIHWLKREPNRKTSPSTCPRGRKLLNQISTIEQEYYSRSPNAPLILAAPIFTLGYPRDRGVPTVSNGNQLLFIPMDTTSNVKRVLLNAGVVRGNSGGPILDSAGKLIGLITGGPGDSMEPEFDSNNPEHFNWGLSAQSLYEISDVFKRIVDHASVLGKRHCK